MHTPPSQTSPLSSATVRMCHSHSCVGSHIPGDEVGCVTEWDMTGLWEQSSGAWLVLLPREWVSYWKTGCCRTALPLHFVSSPSTRMLFCFFFFFLHDIIQDRSPQRVLPLFLGVLRLQLWPKQTVLCKLLKPWYSVISKWKMDDDNSNGLPYKTIWQSTGSSTCTLDWAQLLWPDAWGSQSVWLEFHACPCRGEGRKGVISLYNW